MIPSSVLSPGVPLTASSTGRLRDVSSSPLLNWGSFPLGLPRPCALSLKAAQFYLMFSALSGHGPEDIAKPLAPLGLGPSSLSSWPQERAQRCGVGAVGLAKPKHRAQKGKKFSSHYLKAYLGHLRELPLLGSQCPYPAGLSLPGGLRAWPLTGWTPA
jgi:hypothetical protein